MQTEQRQVLTPREQEILQLLASQRSNKEIGALLDLSVGTVKIHVHHILLKLGARTRQQAVQISLAQQMG